AANRDRGPSGKATLEGVDRIGIREAKRNAGGKTSGKGEEGESSFYALLRTTPGSRSPVVRGRRRCKRFDHAEFRIINPLVSLQVARILPCAIRWCQGSRRRIFSCPGIVVRFPELPATHVSKGFGTSRVYGGEAGAGRKTSRAPEPPRERRPLGRPARRNVHDRRRLLDEHRALEPRPPGDRRARQHLPAPAERCPAPHRPAGRVRGRRLGEPGPVAL